MATLKIQTPSPELFVPAVRAFHAALVAQFTENATNIFDSMDSPTVEMELIVTEKILNPDGSIQIAALKEITELLQHFPKDGRTGDRYSLNETRAKALAACRQLCGYSGTSGTARSSHVTLQSFNAGWFNSESVFIESAELKAVRQHIKRAGTDGVLLIR